MIVRTNVEGRQATVVYIKKDFTPVSEDEAEMIKIIFDDDEVRFAVMAEDKDDEEE